MPKAYQLFDILEQQYANKLPFVVYSRPINAIIKSWMQKDDTLHTTSTFSESGFVFAPFDLKQSAVVFPEAKCSFHDIETGLNFNFKPQPASKSANILEQTKHINLVSKGIAAINSGALKKVVLSRIEEKAVNEVNPITIFKRLYDTYKNAMVYCWYHPKVGLWLGATPELLFKVEGKQLTAISLAGTAPYQPDVVPKWTPKEFEEQQIVTNFLAKQIAPYTVTTNISEVETIRAGNLWHLKTRLISRIADDNSLLPIIKALHPTPAVCGFPKEKAKVFIDKHEGYNRQFYTGFLGELNLKLLKTRNPNQRNIEQNAYVALKTQSNFYVNLRCMQLKANTAYIYVGGGITKDSIAADEWTETCNKALTMSAVLNV